MSSTRFRKRDEALGATMRDMVTAKYVAEAAGAPHSPKGSQVERCGQYGPLGRHVCQTSQVEPPARLLLLDNPEHRLDQLLPQLVRLFSCRGGPRAAGPSARPRCRRPWPTAGDNPACRYSRGVARLPWPVRRSRRWWSPSRW